MMYFMGFDLYFATCRHIPRKKKKDYDLYAWV